MLDFVNTKNQQRPLLLFAVCTLRSSVVQFCSMFEIQMNRDRYPNGVASLGDDGVHRALRVRLLVQCANAVLDSIRLEFAPAAHIILKG